MCTACVFAIPPSLPNKQLIVPILRWCHRTFGYLERRDNGLALARPKHSGAHRAKRHRGRDVHPEATGHCPMRPL